MAKSIRDINISKTLPAVPKRNMSNKNTKKVYPIRGYLKRYTFLQKAVINNAIFPITLITLSTVITSNSVSCVLFNPFIILPSFSLENESA
jgi:hypothetical protein